MALIMDLSEIVMVLNLVKLLMARIRVTMRHKHDLRRKILLMNFNFINQKVEIKGQRVITESHQDAQVSINKHNINQLAPIIIEIHRIKKKPGSPKTRS